MADWGKFVRKSDLLEDGEEVMSTLQFLPHGGLKKVGIAGGIGGVLGAAGAAAGMQAGAKRALESTEHDGSTMADQFPVCFGLISVTDRRILVFDRGSAAGRRPQRILAEYPLGAITGASSKKSFMKRDLTLTFSDGSSLLLDGGMAQPYDRFEEALRA